MAKQVFWPARVQRDHRTPFWLYGFWLCACTGQSGNEGEWPAAPCARNAALLVGTIAEVGAGCVSVHVDRVVAAGEPLRAEDGKVFFDGNAAAGTLLRGQIGSTYAYRHEFKADETVAVMVEPSGEQLALQLFPLAHDRVQVMWGRQALELEPEALAASDCQEKLEARRMPQPDVIVNGSGSAQTTPAAAEEVVCKP